MINLIEHVIVDDFVAANEILESHLNSIVERKLYEKKRMMQAEVFGGMTKAELDARKKAGYRKATDVLGDPDKATKLSPAAKRYRETLKKKKKEQITENLGAGAKAVHLMTPREKAAFKMAMALRRLGGKTTQNIPSSGKPNKKDPYEGKGNAPWTMAARGYHKIKQSVKDYKPEAPGSTVVKASKAIGKGAADAVGRVAGEIASYSNLEE